VPLFILLGFISCVGAAMAYPPIAAIFGRGPWVDQWLENKRAAVTQRENERLVALCSKYERMLDEAGIRR
jgi:hypothetical protein